jgi:hypothetical protein
VGAVENGFVEAAARASVALYVRDRELVRRRDEIIFVSFVQFFFSGVMIVPIADGK